MSAGDLAASAIVRTHEQAAELGIPPLLVLEPLEAYLDGLGLGHGEIEAAMVGDGHSNVNFVLRRRDAEIVIRRPPRPPLPPSAHDVAREARILRALGGRVKTPEILAICEDPAVIGAPFYLMDFLDGEVIGPSLPDTIGVETRKHLAFEMVDALAELHAIDLAEAGLDRIGRPDGYLERQVRLFRGLWESGRTREIETMTDAGLWLEENLPASGPATMVHGDFRLGNMMFARDGRSDLLAILDWEMATIGDPLADVGYMVAMWAEPDDVPNPMLDLSMATRQPGFPGRVELRERYAERSGRELGDLGWYEVLALWKAAIFLENSYSRYVAGLTEDEYFGSLGQGIPAIAEAIAGRMERFSGS